MFIRKVQVTGGGTFFVTLPKEWAARVGIRQGGEVELVPSPAGPLLVIPKGLRERNRCSIPLDGRGRVELERDIIAHYIAGFDVIEVKGSRVHSQERRMVREITQGLIGMEILEETQFTVVLHSVVDIRDFPTRQTIHRIFDITLGMLDDGVSAFLSRDGELARDVIERDSEVDRLALLIARQFSLLLRDLLSEAEAGMSRFQFLYHHTVADQLERVADHGAKISQAALSLQADLLPPVAERVEGLHRESRTVLVEAVRAFEGSDTDKANTVLAGKEDRKRLLELAQLLATEQPENAPPISIVMDSLLRAREYGFNIAEVALDSAVAANRRPS
jgi:phosphate uptake regulator